MPYSSLEDFITAADAIGEVEYVEEADLELEVGCLTELLGEPGGPMPVFDKIPGYPAGYRICSNTTKSMQRFCLALDLPLDIHPLELLRLSCEKRKVASLIPAKVVKDGPIMDCIQEGDAVNLASLRNVFSSEERKLAETKWRDPLEKAAKKRSAYPGGS